MLPSWAVINTVIVLVPTTSEIGSLANPDATDVPSTFAAAVVSANVGVTVSAVMALATLVV